MHKKTGFLIALIVGISLFQVGCSDTLTPKIEKLQARVAALEKQLEATEEEEVEIAPYMMRLQRYLENIYYAGKEENEELVAFYIHEMEEVMEELVDFGIYEDGVDVSANMRTYGIVPLEGFEENYNETNFKYFDDRYTKLVSNCNACHAASDRAFIQLIKPSITAPSGQDFAKIAN